MGALLDVTPGRAHSAPGISGGRLPRLARSSCYPRKSGSCLYRCRTAGPHVSKKCSASSRQRVIADRCRLISASVFPYCVSYAKTRAPFRAQCGWSLKVPCQGEVDLDWAIFQLSDMPNNRAGRPRAPAFDAGVRYLSVITFLAPARSPACYCMMRERPPGNAQTWASDKPCGTSLSILTVCASEKVA